MEEQSPKSWIAAIYTPQWFKIFSRMSWEKYGVATDSHELAEDARQKLASSLARLDARRTGQSLSRAYILVAFKTALVDAFRERHGKPAPRKWLTDLGAIGGRLFDLYCLLRLSFEEILSTLRRDAEYRELLADPSGAAEQQIRGIIWEMDRRQECDGQPRRVIPVGARSGEEEHEEPLIDPASPGAGPDAQAEAELAEALFRLLYGAPLGSMPHALGKRLQEVAATLWGQRLLLSDEDAFILRCFRDGIPEARVGELLGGLTVRQVRYRRENAIDKLRALLKSVGVSYEDFLDESA